MSREDKARILTLNSSGSNGDARPVPSSAINEVTDRDEMSLNVLT